MGKLKNMALVNAPLATSRDPRKVESFTEKPTRFTYALASYSVELRDKGWYVARSVPTFTGDKPEWSGPFETIETACLAIGRRLATEIADRHTRMVETHKIKADDPLYGLKKTTRLRQPRKAKSSVA